MRDSIPPLLRRSLVLGLALLLPATGAPGAAAQARPLPVVGAAGAAAAESAAAEVAAAEVAAAEVAAAEVAAAEVAAAGARSATPAAAATGWGWPLPGRPAVLRPFQPPPAPWLSGHRGVDLAGPPGTPVLAAGSGVVAFAGSVAGVPVVSVEHPGGLRTTYQPVVAAVARGDPVARGEVIGTLLAAPSHCLPASCLHWGLRRGETYLDPLSLVGLDLRVRLLPVWAP